MSKKISYNEQQKNRNLLEMLRTPKEMEEKEDEKESKTHHIRT